jgi:exodeoxyribonuclease-3
VFKESPTTIMTTIATESQAQFPKLKILSLNVNSLRMFPKRLGTSLQEWMNTQNADIVCLQETKLSNIDQAIAIQGYDGYFSISQTKKGYSGVATYVRKGLQCSNVQENFGSTTNNEGRVLYSDHGQFVLFNVYVPNPGLKCEKPDRTIAFYKTLLDICMTLKEQGCNVIIIGDINIAHHNIDTHNPKSITAFSPPAREMLSYLINDSTFIDTYRYLYPNVQQFTCIYSRGQLRNLKMGWRIDYALMSINCIDKLISSEIQDVNISDHLPIVLTLGYDIRVQTTELVIEE